MVKKYAVGVAITTNAVTIRKDQRIAMDVDGEETRLGVPRQGGDHSLESSGSLRLVRLKMTTEMRIALMPEGLVYSQKGGIARVVSMVRHQTQLRSGTAFQ